MYIFNTIKHLFTYKEFFNFLIKLLISFLIKKNIDLTQKMDSNTKQLTLNSEINSTKSKTLFNIFFETIYHKI